MLLSKWEKVLKDEPIKSVYVKMVKDIIESKEE